jgi:hypothetical protein
LVIEPRQIAVHTTLKSVIVSDQNHGRITLLAGVSLLKSRDVAESVVNPFASHLDEKRDRLLGNEWNGPNSRFIVVNALLSSVLR